MALPIKIDHSPYHSPHPWGKQQGTFNACAAWSFVAAAEFCARRFTDKHDFVGSQLWVHKMAFYQEGMPNIMDNLRRGMTPSAVANVVHHFGVPPESVCPYTVDEFLKPVDFKARTQGFFQRLNIIEVPKYDLGEIMYRLTHDCPVVIDHNIWTNWGFGTQSGGPIQNGRISPHPIDPRTGIAYKLQSSRHTICLSGFDRDKGYVMGKQSLDAGWGRDGYKAAYCTLTFDMFDGFVAEAKAVELRRDNDA